MEDCHSRWTLSKVWNKDLQELMAAHKASNFKLLSRLHFGRKICEALYQGSYKDIDPSDYFVLAEVSKVLPVDKTREVRELTVRGYEPRIAENWFIRKQELKINVKFYSGLSDFIKDRLKPGDIIIVCGGRLYYNCDEGVAQVDTNKSFSTSVHVILFRPNTDNNATTENENIQDYKRYCSKFPRWQFECYRDTETDLIEIYPKTIGLATADGDMPQGSLDNCMDEEPVEEPVEETVGAESDNDDNDSDGDQSTEPDNGSYRNKFLAKHAAWKYKHRSTKYGQRERKYRWKKMPFLQDSSDEEYETKSNTTSSVVESETSQQQLQNELSNHWGDSALLENVKSGDEDVNVELKEQESATVKNTENMSISESQEDSSSSTSDDSDSNPNKSPETFPGVSDVSSIELDKEIEVVRRSPIKEIFNAKQNKPGCSRMTEKGSIAKPRRVKDIAEARNCESEASSSPISLVSFNPRDNVPTPDFINPTATATAVKRNGKRSDKQQPSTAYDNYGIQPTS